MYNITASIVIYQNKPAILNRAIKSFLNTDLTIKLYLIDNSPLAYPEKNSLGDKRIEYIFNNRNIGFGRGHNIALRKLIDNTKYHLILNPDIFFERGVLENLYSFMESHPAIGLIMPKVLSFDESLQYLCRLLPTPYDLILRRFNSKLLKAIFKNSLEKHELKFTQYNRVMQVPYLSGCFMFVRNEAVKKIGLFDERFFMYLEDVDLSRRIGREYKTIYYPQAVIYHGFEKGSYKNSALLWHHIISAVRYFNKWGWFFDKERRRINREAFSQFDI